MKHIWFTLLFTAAVGNIALAGASDFTGGWIVTIDDVGEAGITTTIKKPVSAPTEFTLQSADFYGDAAGRPNMTLGEARALVWTSTNDNLSTVFSVISAGTFFEFAANGSKLTGSKIHGETEETIIDGKISGNKITFTVK